MKKTIPSIREWEGNEKIYSHNSGTGIRGLHSWEWTGTGIPAHPCNLLPNYAIAVLFIGSLCVDLLRWGRSRESGRWRWGRTPQVGGPKSMRWCALVNWWRILPSWLFWRAVPVARSLGDQIFDGVVVENLK